MLDVWTHIQKPCMLQRHLRFLRDLIPAAHAARLYIVLKALTANGLDDARCYTQGNAILLIMCTSLYETYTQARAASAKPGRLAIQKSTVARSKIRRRLHCKRRRARPAPLLHGFPIKRASRMYACMAAMQRHLMFRVPRERRMQCEARGPVPLCYSRHGVCVFGSRCNQCWSKRERRRTESGPTRSAQGGRDQRKVEGQRAAGGVGDVAMAAGCGVICMRGHLRRGCGDRHHAARPRALSSPHKGPQRPLQTQGNTRPYGTNKEQRLHLAPACAGPVRPFTLQVTAVWVNARAACLHARCVCCVGACIPFLQSKKVYDLPMPAKARPKLSRRRRAPALFGRLIAGGANGLLSFGAWGDSLRDPGTCTRTRMQTHSVAWDVAGRLTKLSPPRPGAHTLAGRWKDAPRARTRAPGEPRARWSDKQARRPRAPRYGNPWSACGGTQTRTILTDRLGKDTDRLSTERFLNMHAVQWKKANLPHECVYLKRVRGGSPCTRASAAPLRESSRAFGPHIGVRCRRGAPRHPIAGS